MTCISGIVENNRVVIGGDSAGVAGWDLCVRKDAKVFQSSGFLYGFTSSFRLGDVLRYQFSPPSHEPDCQTDVYLRTLWVTELRKVLTDSGYATKKDGREEGGQFLFGYKGRLFFMDGDYQVGEPLAGHHAVGCGAPYAIGALSALRNSGLSIEEKIGLSLRAAEDNSAGVRGPFTIKALE